jgi:branched-chain amino acid transport system ATP-binding protein
MSMSGFAQSLLNGLTLSGIYILIAHRLLVINFGKPIAEGTPDEIKAHPEVISAYLGAGHA